MLTPNSMTKRGTKKANIVDYDSDAEVAEVAPIPRVEIIYEDTKAVTKADPEFKWGQIYHLLVEKKVPEAGLEDLALYDNVLRSRITKVTTRLEMFPYAEVIGWILPRIDKTWMLMSNAENNGFASFAPAFLLETYSFPEKEISVTTQWVKSLKLDYIATTKMMMVEGKNFRNKQLGEYKTTHLRTPYRLIVLLLNMIYDRADGKFYKFGWIALIYHIAMKGTEQSSIGPT